MVRRTVAVALFLTAVSTASAAGKGPDVRTPEEWLKVVAARTAEQKRTESPARRKLLEGAAQALHPYDGRADMLAKGRRAEVYAPYRRWLEEGPGAELLARWRQGRPFPEDSEKDFWLLHGAILWQHKRHVRTKQKNKKPLTRAEQQIAEYVDNVVGAGREALKKGYLSGRLSADDLRALRAHAMYVDLKCCGGRVLPFHLGLSGYTFPGRRPPLGETPPGFTLLRFDVPLGWETYSDRNPRDPTDVLRPAVLREFLLAMTGYRRDPDAAGESVVPLPIDVPAGREADYVRLSSFRGRKGVLFIMASPTDFWAWHWKLAPLVEPLKRAYEKRLEVFFVATTVHDTYMPVMDFFSDSPRARHSAVHPVSYEHRARTAKMFYMDFPQCTTPYLLDDPAQRMRDAYRDQGGGAYVVLVGRDGKTAYVDYHQDIPGHWGAKGLRFPEEFVAVRMNHLESRLASFFANGAVYGKPVETPWPPWRMTTEPILDKGAAAIWLAGRIEKVSDGGAEIVVRRHPLTARAAPGLRFWADAGEKAHAPPETARRLAVVRGWAAGKDQTVRFGLTGRTWVFLDGRAAAAEDLKPGDPVGVKYGLNARGEDGSPVPAAHVRAYRAAVK